MAYQVAACLATHGDDMHVCSSLA